MTESRSHLSFALQSLAVLAAVIATAGACNDSPGPQDAGPGQGPIPAAFSADGAQHSDHVGSAVATDGDLVVVGAPGDDQEAPDAGIVYVYQRTDLTFTEIARLTRPDGGRWGDAFGTAVAIDGDLVYAGAPGVDTTGSDRRDVGAVYVFHRNGNAFDPVAQLDSPAPFVNQQFGASITATPDLVLVGMPGADLESRDVGVVVAFTRDGTDFVPALGATTGTLP